MKAYVKVKGRRYLPEKRKELLAVMWKESIAHSYAGIADHRFNRCHHYSLKFDKWLQDPRLSKVSCPFIEFEIPGKLRQPNNYIVIEIDDHAPFVNLRAFHRVVLFMAERQRTKGRVVGKISVDGVNWITPAEYREAVREYVDCSFEDALERSIADNTV